MTISNDGYSYGICWNIYDMFDNLIRRYEKTYLNAMASTDILEIKEDYEKLTDYEKKYAKFRYFAKCTTQTQYDTRKFMCWIPIEKNKLEMLFIIQKNP
jgi:hypothetical protein